MGKKTTTELEEEIKKLIKVNQSNFAEHQRSQMELRDIIRKKDKEINVCRTVIEKKDQKISALEKQVLSLKFEEETDKAIVERLYAKIAAHKNQIELLTDEKEQLKNEYDDKLNECSINVESLETKNKLLNRNSLSKANLLKNLEELSNTRRNDFEKLKISLQQVQRSQVEKCRFGTKCRRWMCKFSHSHLFLKDNRVKKELVCEPEIATDVEKLANEQKNVSSFTCIQSEGELQGEQNLNHKEHTDVNRLFVKSNERTDVLENCEEFDENYDHSTFDTVTDNDASSNQISTSESDEEESSESESGEDSYF